MLSGIRRRNYLEGSALQCMSTTVTPTVLPKAQGTAISGVLEHYRVQGLILLIARTCLGWCPSSFDLEEENANMTCDRRFRDDSRDGSCSPKLLPSLTNSLEAFDGRNKGGGTLRKLRYATSIDLYSKKHRRNACYFCPFNLTNTVPASVRSFSLRDAVEIHSEIVSSLHRFHFGTKDRSLTT